MKSASILLMASRIAETAPETQRSPGVDTTVTDMDADWQDDPMTQKSPESPDSKAPDSDWDAIGSYIGIIKDTIDKLEDELPS